MAKQSENQKKIVKVVYFDEGSATDFIYVLAGGKEETKSEKIVEKTVDISAKANAEAGGKLNIFSLFSAKIGAEAEAEMMREGKSLVTKALETTVLTEYLKTVKAEGASYIKVFSNCKPYPYPNSFAYFKMITPYLSMTDGAVHIDDDFKLNLALMDKALDSGRGYYELVAEDNGRKVVLRFNIKAFRNNYYISDLVKMNLEYHAIEVGTISEKQLAMELEFGDVSSKGEKDISGYDVIDSEHNQEDEMISVYDVIMAGVSI